MAGRPVLPRLADQDLEAIQNAWLADNFAVPVPSGAAHAAGTDNGVGGRFPGWNEGSRAVPGQAPEDRNLPNRSGLPPRNYLGSGVGQVKAGTTAGCFTRNALAGGWVTELPRPPGLGLSELHVDARADCPNNKAEAFAKQIRVNGASLEIC